ncbi:MAG: thioredoxin-disulfide reductase [candidate division WOR-3 bacterium]
MDYDVIIIGAGPGGLTAGIYAGRANLKTLILEKEAIGGQIALTEKVEDYPGFPEGINAQELIKKFEEHAKKFGAEIVFEEAKEIIIDGKYRIVKTPYNEYKGKTIIVATGARHKTLDIPGEKEFRGRGVSYCAICDGPFFKDKDIVVVGGGDTAILEAIYLTKFGKKVYIVHRRNKFRASAKYVERAKENKKIEFLLENIIKEIYGKNKVEGVILQNVKTKEEKNLSASAVFIFVGFTPNYEILKGIAEIDENGGVLTNEKMETNIPGIYAIGDVRSKSLRQIITSASDGAIAAMAAYEYIEENFK